MNASDSTFLSLAFQLYGNEENGRKVKDSWFHYCSDNSYSIEVYKEGMAEIRNLLQGVPKVTKELLDEDECI